MDNVRLVLVFALAFILLLLWQAWQKDYGPTPAPPAAESRVAPGEAPSPPEDLPSPTVDLEPSSAAPSGDVPGPVKAGPAGETVRVRTDVLDVEIDTRGGTLVEALLLDYPKSSEDSDPVVLLTGTGPDYFVAQSGLIGADEALAPTHRSVFEAEQNEYQLADGQEELQVRLLWTHPSGLAVTKLFHFRRGSYVVDVEQQVTNSSGSPWAARDYRQLQRTEPPGKNGDARFIHTFTGAAIYSPADKYQKISFSDIRDQRLEREVQGGWISMIQHYFLSAWVPPADSTETFFSKALPSGRYLIGTYGPGVSVPDGGSHTFSARLWVGPKLQDEMAALAPGLELTVDYGWLTVIAKPLHWLLDKLHGLVGNWGWSIILLTILIKLVFYKLSETSYKSMANMRRMAPRLQSLKERYGDDKQRLNQAMMELYKKEKINPLGGCLPILVQIPVFISLYWVLIESVELRDAPWILWIHSLSEKDPYFILPLIMGVSMFIQQRLNPAPPDPLQAKIMMSLPFVFTIFFAFFPAGLVLYWAVNNILSIAQQWYITRKIEQAAKA
ncbi:MAG: membrane protein insertase YidC [Chromatiales bacterium]|jgi:YidC/Oxa1 family membrane protein insertase